MKMQEREETLAWIPSSEELPWRGSSFLSSCGLLRSSNGLQALGHELLFKLGEEEEKEEREREVENERGKWVGVDIYKQPSC